MEKVVFSDVDGTLLTSNHEISNKTLLAINKLEENNIPFVIVSARSPSGIYPILEQYKFKCPIISYSGALILDKDRNVLYHKGIEKSKANSIIEFLEHNQFDLTWCLYSFDEWVVKDKTDKRVIREETIVKAQAIEGNINTITANEIHKILCICNIDKTAEIEKVLKENFKDFSIVRSSPILIEIMEKGINKAKAISELCNIFNISLNDTVAFGDNYNDLEMLNTVSKGFLMDNAPTELKNTINLHTNSNDNDGIYYALAQLNLI